MWFCSECTCIFLGCIQTNGVARPWCVCSLSVGTATGDVLCSGHVEFFSSHGPDSHHIPTDGSLFVAPTFSKMAQSHPETDIPDKKVKAQGFPGYCDSGNSLLRSLFVRTKTSFYHPQGNAFMNGTRARVHLQNTNLSSASHSAHV